MKKRTTKPFRWGHRATKAEGSFPVSLNVRLTRAQATEVHAWVKKRGLSVSAGVRRLIKAGLSKEK